jgi:thymidine kinase
MDKIDFSRYDIFHKYHKTTMSVFTQSTSGEAQLNEGYLELWLGPMFSGKTTHLIQAYKKYTYIGKHVAVVNYAADKRYHETMLSTHDKTMIPCIQTETLDEIFPELMAADVILINEGQFFKDLYDCVIQLINLHNKTVCISALDGDFKRERFGDVLHLIPQCDKVTKLHALCSSCKNGKPAIFSHRITCEEGQVVIGSDNYVPLCRSCFQQQCKL